MNYGSFAGVRPAQHRVVLPGADQGLHLRPHLRAENSNTNRHFIALVIVPVLVRVSWAIGHPMNLVFGSPLDLFAIAATAFIVRSVAAEGETTWFEGPLLVGVYLLFALAYDFASPG